MEFIKILLENSTLKEAKIYPAAKRASDNPSIGITIQNQAAFHVIKDCANITMRYLPHMVLASYENPFVSLKGKFKKEHIAEFVTASEKDYSVKQLLELIVCKATKLVLNTSASPSTTNINRDSHDDPYGDYGLDEPIQDVPQPSSESPSAIIDLLLKAFNIQ